MCSTKELREAFIRGAERVSYPSDWARESYREAVEADARRVYPPRIVERPREVRIGSLTYRMRVEGGQRVLEYKSASSWFVSSVTREQIAAYHDLFTNPTEQIEVDD